MALRKTLVWVRSCLGRKIAGRQNRRAAFRSALLKNLRLEPLEDRTMLSIDLVSRDPFTQPPAHISLSSATVAETQPTGTTGSLPLTPDSVLPTPSSEFGMWDDQVDDGPAAAIPGADSLASVALSGSYTTMISNGPSANRVDIVMLGDGYTAGEIETTYVSHINSFLNYLFHQGQDPFPRYANFFNVHRINVVSNESGADIPPQGIYRDTALDASYYYDGTTERLLYVNTSKANAAISAGLADAGFSAEMKPVTVNHTKYGGGGGYYAVYAGGNSSATEVALHEMGHSFDGLADEYDYSGGARYTGSEPIAANVTISPTGAKWSAWNGYTDSLGTVGAYEGAMYKTYGIYRPTYNSKMRALGVSFNAVSRDKIIRDIYALVDPLDAWQSNIATIAAANPELWVDVVDPAVINVEWRVDGALVAGATTESFRPAEHGFAPGVHTVSARAYDPTDWVRSDRSSLEQTVTWTVDIQNHAPVLDANGTAWLAGIAATGDGNSGTLISSLLADGGSRVNDPDPGALGGVAVVGADTTHGSWEFSLDDGGLWNALGTASPTSARLLAADPATRVRFVPQAGFRGTIDPGLTFRAWDQTTGANGGLADTTTSGTATAFSAASATAAVSVAWPYVANPIPDLEVCEDASPSTLDISSVFADPDAGETLSLAVTTPPTVGGLVSQVSVANYTHLLDDLLYTHSGNSRGLGGAQHDLARDNIQSYFQGLGLSTALEPFTYSSATYNNVVATQPGTTRPNDVYLVGAHFDSVNCPGADDNASGTAAVMEIARVLSQYSFDCTLKYVAFDREEQGLIGSYAYVVAHPGQQILGMVNLDMIAYNPAGTNRDKISLYDYVVGGSMKSNLAAAIAAYAPGVTPVVQGQIWGSDHSPFEQAGYDAALMIEYNHGSNPYYHSVTDSVDTAGYIDYTFATKIVRAAVGYLVGAASLVPASTLVSAALAGTSLQLNYASNMSGVYDVTLRATDPTLNQADDTFRVTVLPVNDAPSFTAGANQFTFQAAGPQTVSGWAGSISAGPPDEAAQALDFIVTTDNDSLFAAGPVINADGTLIYTPAANRSGTATVSVRLHDNGGTAHGGLDTSAVQTFTITVQATIAGRQVFYNNSYYDADPSKGRDDDNAIATDKQPLLPSQTATFVNYTSYIKGLNGIMVDVAGMGGTPTINDFLFRYGNAGDVTSWTTWTGTPTIAVRPGAGTAGSDRITITWPDYNVLDPTNPNSARAKTWLQITVLATANTSLAANDVFYFGNAIGESGNVAGKTLVDAFDFSGARDNPHNFLNRALVTDPYDFNRDSLVDAFDLAIVRDNNTNFLSCLTLITAPLSGGTMRAFAAQTTSEILGAASLEAGPPASIVSSMSALLPTPSGNPVLAACQSPVLLDPEKQPEEDGKISTGDSVTLVVSTSATPVLEPVAQPWSACGQLFVATALPAAGSNPVALPDNDRLCAEAVNLVRENAGNHALEFDSNVLAQAATWDHREKYSDQLPLVSLARPPLTGTSAAKIGASTGPLPSSRDSLAQLALAWMHVGGGKRNPPGDRASGAPAQNPPSPAAVDCVDLPGLAALQFQSTVDRVDFASLAALQFQSMVDRVDLDVLFGSKAQLRRRNR